MKIYTQKNKEKELWSFKKKILVSDVILLLIFIALLFPLVNKSVDFLIKRSLKNRLEFYISNLQKEKNIEQLIDTLKHLELRLFFRITLADQHQQILFDSKRIKDYHKKIEKKKHRGIMSFFYTKPFFYVAKKFIYHDEPLTLRVMIPSKEIDRLTTPFQIIFFVLGVFFLLLYSIVTGIIVLHVSRPIQYIINSIQTYRGKKEKQPPYIPLKGSLQHTLEFRSLAKTLNDLSRRIKQQITSLTDQKNENEAILDSLNEGVVSVNKSLYITYANTMAGTITGRDKQSLIGIHLSEIAGEKDILKKCELLVNKTFSTKKSQYASIIIGEDKKTYFNIVALPKKKANGVIIVVQDKTADYKVIEMGKNFVANASHELRTPITIIQGFAETLVDIPNLSDQMLKKISEKIVKTSHKLSNIVQDLLTMTQVENSSLEKFVPQNLVTLIENCKEYILSMHSHAQISLEYNKDVTIVLADSGLLELAINNLLENAVKYSLDQVFISIKIIQEDTFVTVHIKDQGIGIPQSAIDRIFDRFFTLDKISPKKFKGVGLGLSLVKTIVEKHKGTIEVVSELNTGSCFTLTFPVYKEEHIMN